MQFCNNFALLIYSFYRHQNELQFLQITMPKSKVFLAQKCALVLCYILPRLYTSFQHCGFFFSNSFFQQYLSLILCKDRTY